MQLIDKAVELRGSQILNMQTYQSVVFQRRLMAIATVLAWVAVVLLIVALATTQWAVISFVNDDWQNVKVELGVWGEWRTITKFPQNTVEWIPHFPTPPDNIARLANTALGHYYRGQACFGAISLLLLLSTNSLAIYTFYHHRYIYKRFTGALYIIVAVAIIVTIEILTNSVDQWNTAVAHSNNGAFDYDTHMETGYSRILAQVVVAICIFAAFVFLLASHKQKGDQAATMELEIEDRPVHIGRT